MSFTIVLLGTLLATAAAIITCPPSEKYFFADPDDCTKFYQCFYGKLEHYTCYSGLYFDPIKEFCISLENNTCGDVTVAPTFSTQEFSTVTLPEFTTDLTETSAEVSDTTTPYSIHSSTYSVSTEFSDMTVPLSSTTVPLEPSTQSSTESPDITESSPGFTESSTEISKTPGLTTFSTESSSSPYSLSSPYDSSSETVTSFPVDTTTFTPKGPVTLTVMTSTQSSSEYTEFSDMTVPLSSTTVPFEPSTQSSTESPDITESSPGFTESSTETSKPPDLTTFSAESSSSPYSQSSPYDPSTERVTSFPVDTTTFTPKSPVTLTVMTSTQSSGLPNCSDSSDGFFPYSYDCQFYYECISGIPELNYCLPGYNWNIEINACDPEGNVDCSHISTTSTTPEYTAHSDNTDVTCPDTPGTTYYAHPYDCAYFYECYNGNKTLLRCVEGYLWNDQMHACDVASKVDCKHTSTRPQTTRPTAKLTTEAVETTTTGNRCKGEDDEGKFFPDLEDCSQYVRCDHGIETILKCANGTIWDESLVTCVNGSC